MNYIAVDLGSTNIKVAVFDDNLICLGYESTEVIYQRNKKIVEFDADEYVNKIYCLISNLVKRNIIIPNDIKQIIFTGQAESLVVIDEKGKCLRNAISWMDERSVKECAEMEQTFSKESFFNKTGQQAILPTWPATKIKWLKTNEREIFDKAYKFVLLKDFVVFRFSGVLKAEFSIATFSFYFDIYKKEYWKEMLDYIGISTDKLPYFVEPGTVIGKINTNTQKNTGLDKDVEVNVGVLDHFAGMIGCGNIKEGIVSYSTGTVMALASFADPQYCSSLAIHYGYIPDSYIILPVAESGGICLQWFRNNFISPDISYSEIDKALENRKTPNKIIFLPYIVGTNSPEFDINANGSFHNIRFENDAIDFAYAVMEGVGFLLKKNCDEIIKNGIKIDKIIATCGGAKSDFWCQLQSDITGLPIIVPENNETACLGAAIMGMVSSGDLSCYEDSLPFLKVKKTFYPRKIEMLEKKFQLFCSYYDFETNMKNQFNK